ncbi:hypothetical protein [Desulfogranum japonicum]|uniref:hypothetical protein n=1 Tax=Desulfogranum japonicum TaxID=231447 RepID=UPI00041545DB|nr:hypothetical protein [Desulfogranum japonicum]
MLQGSIVKGFDSDGNIICYIQRKYVFVTEGLYDGSFSNGLVGAHAACNTEAEAAGLTGVYLAWISDSTLSPLAMMMKHQVPYVLPSNEVVASDWEDLTDGALYHAINQTADGTVVTSGYVWTATSVYGTHDISHGVANCSNWTTSSNLESAGTGDVLANNNYWSDNSGSQSHSCDEMLRIYCIQQ